MYVKLFGSILTSSIWSEDPATRLVWITLLALADAKGHVRAAPSGLARMANVSEADCSRAIGILQGPDPESASPEYEGRRIEPVDGGWLLLNYQRYREIRTEEQLKAAARQRAHYQRQQRETSRQSRTEVEAEAEVDTETTTKSKPSTPRKKRVTWMTPYWDAWVSRYGGNPASGQLAKAMRPLHDQHGQPEVLVRWTRYLAATEARYASPSKFSQTWGAWNLNGKTPQSYSYTPGQRGPTL